MSQKFHVGDMVRFEPHSGNYIAPLEAGMTGTLIFYIGSNTYSNIIVENAWVVFIDELNAEAVINELSLVKIPGNQDTKQIGKWDECPWAPPGFKRATEVPNFSEEVTNDNKLTVHN